HIVNPEERDELLVACYVRAARIDENGVALCGVMVSVALRQFPDSLPGADVRPAIGNRHDGCVFSTFHYRVVNRFGGGAAKRFGIKRDETEIGAGRLPRSFDGPAAVRLETSILFQQKSSAKDKITGVPNMPFGDIARRRFRIWLFNETFDSEQ